MQVIIIKNCHLLMTEPPTHLPTNRQALLRVCPLSRLTQGGARGGGILYIRKKPWFGDSVLSPGRIIITRSQPTSQRDRMQLFIEVTICSIAKSTVYAIVSGHMKYFKGEMS